MCYLIINDVEGPEIYAQQVKGNFCMILAI